MAHCRPLLGQEVLDKPGKTKLVETAEERQRTVATVGERPACRHP